MAVGITAGSVHGEVVSEPVTDDVALGDSGYTVEDRDPSGANIGITRRSALISGGGALIAAAMFNKPDSVAAETGGKPSREGLGTHEAGMLTVDSETTISFKDWGPKNAQPIMFHHGWPLSADDWDAQMLYFLRKGYRVIAHDRQGHGRSSQVNGGHDMDHYAADVSAVVSHLGLRDVVHIGHSTGGGEALHYVARHGKGRVAKLILVGAVPPLMLKTAENPGGMPIEVFDGFRKQVAGNRAQFYLDIASGPFYGFNRPDAKVSQGVIQNWWRQGMMGSAKAHYDGIKAFSETDFTEDLKTVEVPTLIMHGDDDQLVPIANSALRAKGMLRNGTLKVYEKLSHGMLTTHAELINPDLLAFCEGKELAA